MRNGCLVLKLSPVVKLVVLAVNRMLQIMPVFHLHTMSKVVWPLLNMAKQNRVSVILLLLGTNNADFIKHKLDLVQFDPPVFCLFYHFVNYR